ncbi:hypothetical protein Mapa_003568 [Marchantia paleacea]|nr:hypothetical protein Mapa_003568 [Marchantia paleacea]
MTVCHIPDKMSRIPGKVEESQSPWLPPGFRFHPTDEELVTYYLDGKVRHGNQNVHCQAITEVDLNKCEPWELPDKAKMGEKEWYFFSLRDRKYPTGMRTNRATDAGYWKATGKDREVMSSRSGRLVGMKKTLVFYLGRAPKGGKTNWIMHEYRIEGEQSNQIHSPKLSKDEWVVCRIFQKSAGGKKNPLECNRSSSYNTDAQVRSSLPALLESPNPNSVGEESDTCLIDGNYHPLDNMGAAAGAEGGNKSNSNNNNTATTNNNPNPWQLKVELEDTLESLQGKNSSALLRCPSYIMDSIFTEMGAGGASSLKLGGGTAAAAGAGTFGPKLARQDTSAQLHPHNLSIITFKYLEQQQQQQQHHHHQRVGMNSSMRTCKAEPYAGEEDDAQSSQRSSMMESWVGESNGFSTGEAGPGAAGGLQSLGSESGVAELEQASLFRTFNRGMFPDPSNSCPDLVEGLWSY